MNRTPQYPDLLFHTAGCYLHTGHGLAGLVGAGLTTTHKLQGEATSGCYVGVHAGFGGGGGRGGKRDGLVRRCSRALGIQVAILWEWCVC